MFNWFFSSLSRQVSFLLVIIMLVTLTAFAVFFYNIQSNLLQQSTKQMARQLITSTINSNAKHLHFNEHYAAWKDIDGLIKNNLIQIEQGALFRIDELALIDTQGNTFAHNLPKEYPLQKTYNGETLSSLSQLESQNEIVIEWKEKKGSKAARIYAPVFYQGREVGLLILQLDLSLMLQHKQDLIIRFFGFLLIVLLVAIVIGIIFGRWITSPVISIEKSLNKMGTGKLELSQLQQRRDEYCQLAQAIENADQTLFNSKSQVRLLLDSTAESIYGLDNDGHCTFVNPACLSLLGYGHESELLGKNMHQKIHYQYANGAKYPVEDCQIHLAISKKTGVHVDSEVLWRKDGSSVAVECWSHPIYKYGECVGAVVTFIDITERLETQRALQERERGLSLTLDSIGDAVIVTDAAGRISRMNPVAAELTGWNTDHVYGMELVKVFEIINARTRQAVENPVEKVLQSGRIEGLANHTILINKNGEEYQIADSAAPIKDDENNILGVILVFRDVTKQYKTEEALRRSQKMDAIGQLSGGIAHDFNNQLGVVIGYLDFLQEYLEQDEKASRWVNTASKATLRCMDLTRQLLSFSRSQPDKNEVLSINVLLSESKNMLARSMTPLVTIRYELSDDLWLSDLDGGDFQDAILNLVINARDAMPNGGELSVKTSNHHVKANDPDHEIDVAPGKYIQIILKDSGKGMDLATQEKIFEPFFTTKDKGQGTGLGMAMVYGFVKRFDGFIFIESALDKGTTIKIYLPRSQRKAENTEVTSLAKENDLAQGETILIVDDEVELLQLAYQYLSELGYKAYTAENVEQAVKLLQEHDEIDLLFSDVVMPGGTSGYQLADQVLSLRPDCKILLTSGFTSQSVIANSGSKFSKYLLNKPYRKSELASRIRAVLDNLVDD